MATQRLDECRTCLKKNKQKLKRNSRAFEDECALMMNKACALFITLRFIIQLPERTDQLAKLYDKVLIEAKGYTGRVPIHHKAAIVARHFRKKQDIIAGK